MIPKEGALVAKDPVAVIRDTVRQTHLTQRARTVTVAEASS